MTQSPSFSIYNASAGSGKTFTLVKEYLKIILTSTQNDAYRNILAITFTNKAVNEMKTRVVDSLKNFAINNFDKKTHFLVQEIMSETGFSQVQIVEKSKKIIKHLIHNYAAFDILTIDKFTLKVIRSFSFDLNLPISMEVILDTDSLLQEAIDSVVSKAGEDQLLTKLLIDFTMEKADDNKSWDISKDIFDTGKLLNKENDRKEINLFQTKNIQDFLDSKTKTKQLLLDLSAQSSQMAQSALQLISDNGIREESFHKNFIEHLNKIINGVFNPNNKTFKTEDDIKAKSKSPDTNAIEAIKPNLVAIMAKTYLVLEKIQLHEAFIKNLNPLSLINTIAQEVEEIQREQNVLSIAEFNKRIFDELKDQPAPFIYERIGERYNHFFIDEFQDTSEMQWQNLIPLIDNVTSGQNKLGVPGTLLIVGDPKQAIYRFRGGKAEQFISLSKGENPFSNKNQETYNLETNYRSFKEVVAFNNSFFLFLSSKFDNPEYVNLYKNNSFQKTNSNKQGFVNLSFIKPVKKKDLIDDEDLNDNDEMYLEKIQQIIVSSIANGYQYKDIVILTQKKNKGVIVANFLTKAGIDIISSESLLLSASSEVQCLIAIFEFLANHKNLQAKANFLYYLAVNKTENIDIHDFIAAGMAHKSEMDFENWLSEFDISMSFSSLRKKGLYEATEGLISKIIPTEKQNAYIQFFLDVILEHDIKRQGSLNDFLIYWENKSLSLSIPSPEENNAVQIMTIHKSKGLEFPIVIYPFAEKDFARAPKDKIWLNVDETEVGLPKALVNKKKEVTNYGDESNQIYQQINQSDLLDEINVLYVALTRAEEQLYIISALNVNKDNALANNLSSYFIEYLQDSTNIDFDFEKLEYSFGNFERESEKTIENVELEYIKPITEKFDFGNIKIASRESLMWGTQQQDAIEYGNILHEILSLIKSKNDIENALNRAIENGLIVSSQKQIFEKTILEIVNHPNLKDFFDADGKVLNEQAIIQKNGNTIIPDKMVILDKNVALLDYKTGTHQPKYKTQLENYQNAIEKMGYKVTKKTLVYIANPIEIVNL